MLWHREVTIVIPAPDSLFTCLRVSGSIVRSLRNSMVTTASKSLDWFDAAYEALTDYVPYSWQRALYSLILNDQLPTEIALPTGAGKTSIMPIWLLALAKAAENSEPAVIPRKLVWVVNRRVVVDQATAEAERLAKRLKEPALGGVTAALAQLCAFPGDEPLAISTLRGEKEDNRAWSADPSQPAIIVGTVDMVGSRLLFSGYGDSIYRRPQHAGLIGQDTLLVNDEAHLTPAFASLVREIEGRQQSSLKPFRTIVLSATQTSARRWPESLEQDAADPKFNAVFRAPKCLAILDVTGKQERDRELLRLAMEDEAARTIIFVRSPEDAKDIAEKLKAKVDESAKERVASLTGTMRGFERDELALSNPVFKAFQQCEKVQGPYWLVATSAAEVGANISADRLITDCDTLDHLLQRFGRLNRFGESNGRAYLLVADVDLKKNGDRKKATLEFLKKLPQIERDTYDISAAALFGRDLPEDAFSETPLLAPLHPWLIDVWSQTTLAGHPSCPPVESWLHGKQDKEGPETYVAWREDVRVLTAAGFDNEDRESVLDVYPVLAHERLRLPTSVLFKELNRLCEIATETQRHRRLLCEKDGTSRAITLEGLISDGEKQLRYAQLVMPPGMGSLKTGMFSADWPEEERVPSIPYDVSGYAPGYELERAAFRAVCVDDGWMLEPLGVPAERRQPEQLSDLNDSTLKKFAESRGWRLLKWLDPTPDEESEAHPCALLYFGKGKQQSTASERVPLEDHCQRVAEVARKLAVGLALPPEIVKAFEIAGRLHDLGKKERIWQDFAGNPDLEKPIAKPLVRKPGRMLAGFRHELASVIVAREKQEVSQLSDEMRDLVLHLVASHHGRARPCFPTAATFSRESGRRASQEAALQAMQRFARLQRRYGPWGLAYLEAIFKAADGIASAEE